MSECEHKHTGSCSPAGVYLYVKCMDCGAILNESEDGRRLRTECPGFKAERYAPGSCERCHHDAQHHYDALAAENATLRAQIAEMQGERDVAELSRDAAHARLAEAERTIAALSGFAK